MWSVDLSIDKYSISSWLFYFPYPNYVFLQNSYPPGVGKSIWNIEGENLPLVFAQPSVGRNKSAAEYAQTGAGEARGFDF